MKRFTLILALLSFALPVFAEGERYLYTQIAQKEGLTSTVNCIYKEKDGDVWIGTPNGLYSFDGYNLKHFENSLHDSRLVFAVNMDKEGSLWVLTDKHLLRKDAGQETFVKISETCAPFFCIEYDEDGIWVGSMKNIYRYDYSDKVLELFCTLPPEFACTSMGLVDDRHLLCCSHNGKIMIDIRTAEITPNTFGQQMEVSATFVDSNGRVWIALYNRGVEVFEKDGTFIRSYNTGNSDLSNNIVLCFAERGGVILAGTDGGGINIINPQTGKIRTLSHISGDPASLPAHSIKSLFTDHYGNVWAGSVRDGLICISQSEIQSYTDTYIGLDNGLSNPTVNCMHQDKTDGSIWIGTDGEGINRFDPKTSKFTHYPSTFKTKVVSIADYSENELAISTYSDYIWIFDKRTGEIRPMPIAEDVIRYWIRYSGRSINLYNEKDGSLLLFANTIFRYDKASAICTPIPIEGCEKLYSNLSILGTSYEGVWIHSPSSIYLLKDGGGILTHKATHEHGNIRSGHLTPGGIIWMATEEGLCQYNTIDETFRHITTTIFSDATSVICDNRSRVWIGTEKGLSAYLAESGSFALFGKSDGVMANEYMPTPRLLSSDGSVYFGGVHGVLRIGNNYTIETTEIPLLTLGEVMLDGEKLETKHSGRFVAPRGSKSMEINIGITEKDMFRHRVFRFSVSGQTYETSMPVLELRQMPNPGRHDVSVCCTRRNGEWTEPVMLMTLRVPQPWYASWWFITGCIVLMTGIYILTIYSLNKRKSNELRLAMKEQEQKVYEDKVSMLINISHELRTPLTLIMAPLKRLLKMMNSDDGNFPVLTRIYRQSRRMHNLLDMVLDLRKMEVGGKCLKITGVDFNAWIADCVDDIVNEEKAEGIDIVYEFDKAVGRAELDRQKCDIVLMNILINAIKHSASGDTITIKTNMTEDGMVRTSISDQGPGLGADIDPEKMFTRFYQSKNEKYGSGIGLSYSKILVELHGGRIGVYNNPEVGATFWWEIPVSAVHDEDTEGRAYLNELLGHSSEADAASPQEDVFDTSGMRLMLVDDNRDLLDFLREALCDKFADITTVTGGKAALSEISSGRLPDIIVCDVNMPEGDGFWLCNELKGNEKYCHIPFVLLTARGEDQSQSESYRLGADGFIAKPFEMETLMELLRSLLKRRSDIRRKYLDNSEVAETDYGSEEERFILQLNKIIADNLSNPALDQQLICRELGVSRALLYNRMKAITGAGAKEYITRIRIEKAKALIESTSLTIAEISDMTGFASQSYFSTAFKNYVGVSPSQYKKSM